jgi:hypothetical protein
LSSSSRAAAIFSRRRFDVGCTVEVEHSHESLHAHVDLDDDVLIHPGDEVVVHGEEVEVPFGERVVLRRDATVIRASLLERWWTWLTGDLEFMELLEFSFTSGKRL